MLLQASIIIAAFVLGLINAQSIEVALAQQKKVLYFTSFPQQNPDIIELLDNGVHTVLVPTEAEVVVAGSPIPIIFNDSSAIRTLLQYYIFLDTHPLESFPNSSQLIPTLLQNVSYTNVTGGQRVELLQIEGQPTVLSAVTAEPKIVQPDVFYQGGLLHIVDSVLQISLSFPETITKASLSYLVALLNLGGWLAPDSITYQLALETPDLTFLGPNNPAYGAEFDGWAGLTQEELDGIFLYHVMPKLVYTTDMSNNTQHQTMANLSLMAWQFTAGKSLEVADFLDQAQITTSNYITANDVLQIIDRTLDPKQAGSTPSRSDTDKALNIVDTPMKQGLQTSVIAGVAAGAAAILFATVAGLVLLVKRKSKHNTHGNTVPPPNGSISTLATYSYHQTPSKLVAISIPRARANSPSRYSLDKHSVGSFRTDKKLCELHGKDVCIQVYEMSATDQDLPRYELGRVIQAPITKSENELLPQTPSKANTDTRRAAPADFT